MGREAGGAPSPGPARVRPAAVPAQRGPPRKVPPAPCRRRLRQLSRGASEFIAPLSLPAPRLPHLFRGRPRKPWGFLSTCLAGGVGVGVLCVRPGPPARWTRSGAAGRAVRFQRTWEENFINACTEAGTDLQWAVTWVFASQLLISALKMPSGLFVSEIR